MKQTYITLLSSKEYLPAVLALDKNLKDLKCKYPLTVMVTYDIASNICPVLNQFKIPYEIIERNYYNSSALINYLNPFLKNTAPKIQLFKLHKYDKVVYIDADCFFLKCPDELMNKMDGSICEDIETNGGFSGLFVCTPINHSFDFYSIILQNTSCLDGDLFATFWFPFKTNPQYRISMFWFYNIVRLWDKLTATQIYGLHFCNELKPWNFSTAEEYVSALKKEWTQLDENSCLELCQIYFDKYLNPIKKELDF